MATSVSQVLPDPLAPTVAQAQPPVSVGEGCAAPEPLDELLAAPPDELPLDEPLDDPLAGPLGSAHAVDDTGP